MFFCFVHRVNRYTRGAKSMDFREMNVLMPGSRVRGVVYVMWVKPVGGNWKSEDIIYAIVHKANSRSVMGWKIQLGRNV